jgi:hypothetical protein
VSRNHACRLRGSLSGRRPRSSSRRGGLRGGHCGCCSRRCGGSCDRPVLLHEQRLLLLLLKLLPPELLQLLQL